MPNTLSCIALLFAIKLIKSEVKLIQQRRSGESDFFARETLMLVHTSLFAIFILVFWFRIIFNEVMDYTYTNQEYGKYCMLIKLYVFVKVVSTVLNICLIALVGYMSDQLSQPLGQYW